MTADAMIEMHLDRARRLAVTMHRRFPRQVELDDVISDATMGLVEAARAFDPNRGHVFWTLARHRVMGAILDGVGARLLAGHRVKKEALRFFEVQEDQESARLAFDALHDPACSPEQMAMAREKLRRLPTRLRMLTLYVGAGKTCAELAARFGVNESRLSQLRRDAQFQLDHPFYRRRSDWGQPQGGAALKALRERFAMMKVAPKVARPC